MSLNLLFLLHKKLVFQKKVTKSKFVTKFTVTKSEVDCTREVFLIGFTVASTLLIKTNGTSPSVCSKSGFFEDSLAQDKNAWPYRVTSKILSQIPRLSVHP